MYIHPGHKLGMNEKRKSYPSDVSDAEWAFCVNYLTLMTEEAPQRLYPLREIFNALRYQVKMGGVWRMMPHDLPPWNVVYQQTQRWIRAGCLEAMAHDLRAILRLALERKADPSAVILDSRTVQSTPESGARAGFDGHKKRKGSKVHIAADTWATCWRWRSRRPTNRIGRKSHNWRRRGRPWLRSRCRWRLWTKATPGKNRRQPQPRPAFNWKSSNITKPNTGLYCCR